MNPIVKSAVKRQDRDAIYVKRQFDPRSFLQETSPDEIFRGEAQPHDY